MRITVDYATLAFLLDLPDDIDITDVDRGPDGAVFVADAPAHYPTECAASYGTDDAGNVSLLGFSDAPE